MSSKEHISSKLFTLDVDLARRIAKYKGAQDPVSRSDALKEIGDRYDHISSADDAFIASISAFAGAPDLMKQSSAPTNRPAEGERRD